MRAHISIFAGRRSDARTHLWAEGTLDEESVGSCDEVDDGRDESEFKGTLDDNAVTRQPQIVSLVLLCEPARCKADLLDNRLNIAQNPPCAVAESKTEDDISGSSKTQSSDGLLWCTGSSSCGVGSGGGSGSLAGGEAV
jgi:hypothetical protein